MAAWADSAVRLDRVGFAVAAAVSGFAVMWLGCFRIELTPDEMIFRSLFRGKRAIKHSEIKIVRLEWRFVASKGPLRLVVEPKDVSKMARLDINAKVFSKAAINAVLDLGSRVAQADDGGLKDGIVLKTIRSVRRSRMQ